MRKGLLVLLTAAAASAQFRSTVPLVVAPLTITDRDGRFVDGLGQEDLILFDNNVAQPIQVDFEIKPISLVVVVQASLNAMPILDKLHRSGSLFSSLVAGETGETAVVAFSEQAVLVQDFTTDYKKLQQIMKQGIRVQGTGAAVIDGAMLALKLLAQREAGRRTVILMIAEGRDKSSKTQFTTVLREAQFRNTAIYWLTYSKFLAPFTSKQKTKWDRMTDEEKAKNPPDHKFPYPDQEELVRPETPSGSLLSIVGEIRQRTKADASGILTAATGGKSIRFLKQSGLESAIQAVGEEVHRQYILSFQPKHRTPGYHALTVKVRNHPDYQVRTRQGYWSVE